MPPAETILATLSSTANQYALLATFWHGALALALAAVLAGWRPPRRAAAALLLLPLLSVSVLAWIERSFFNGAIFLLLAVALGVIALLMSPARVGRGPTWTLAAGATMIVFAWVYPHFLDNDISPFAYLYSAPMGLLPCPTLALVIGLTLVAGGLGSRSWSLLLATAGLFYGTTGALQLGVVIDGLLILGALALLTLAVLPRPSTTSTRAAAPA